MKDHEIREVVNQLRDVALEFHNHQSLRERIAGILVPLLKDTAVKPPPFGYFHEMLDHEGKGNGIWIGCDSREVTEQSYVEGEVGREIVTLYCEPGMTPQGGK